MEIYVPVNGTNGHYLVSNMGNMMCLSRAGDDYLSMTPMQDRRGYLRVDLYGVKRGALIHRLVAEHFIPNPCVRETVNHKNEIKTDNRVDNLEWLTNSENHNYGTRNARVGKALEKPILRICITTGEVLQRYQCLKAAVADGYNHSSVSRCANGIKLKSSGGFVWRWED